MSVGFKNNTIFLEKFLERFGNTISVLCGFLGDGNRYIITAT